MIHNFVVSMQDKTALQIASARCFVKQEIVDLLTQASASAQAAAKTQSPNSVQLVTAHQEVAAKHGYSNGNQTIINLVDDEPDLDSVHGRQKRCRQLPGGPG